MVHWDADARKDLLVGLSDGTIKLFLNIGTDDGPTFDAGTLLQVGEPGSKVDIDVGARATATVVDWDSDGAKDLVVGAYDGKIHLFLNAGTDTVPDFRVGTYAQLGGSDLVVPSVRSSPAVVDVDGDGKKDLMTGSTSGELLLYANTGTDAAPAFSGYVRVEADGVPIDLAGTPRSRPCVCDWTGDGALDVIVGAADGMVHLYEGAGQLGDFDGDGDVDDADLAQFEVCYTGADGGPVEPGCEPGDFDGDGDIDCDDWDQFLLVWGDPENPPPPYAAPCAEAIPTVSVWGVIALGLLLTLCAMLALRRHPAPDCTP